MFERTGVIVVSGDADEDELMLVAADAGADDVTDDDGVWQVRAEPAAFGDVRHAIEHAGFTIESADVAMLPTTQVEVDNDHARTLLRLVEGLEDNDDVQDVYFNFDIPEAVLEEA
jgi:transcriptional/translational regulatory protein YebC/TACO1